MSDAPFSSARQMIDADNYNDWTFSLFRRYVTGNVLEVGCGVGSFTRRIASECSFSRLLSIDISEDAVNYCRSHLQYPSVDIHTADVREVVGQFDTIICMNVLEHIEDDLGALQNIFDLLKPSGSLFLLVPAHRFLYTPFDTVSGHFRRYDKGSMKSLISRAAGRSPFQLTMRYFNAVGAVGYFMSYGVFRGKAPSASRTGEIRLFDRWVVPVIRRLEFFHIPIGISLVSIIVKE